jgi:uncharacterized protein YeaO (DUF488 family)
MEKVTLARVYDDVAPAGVRVLVDRIWPRGIRRDDARLDHWCKDVAPSTRLRRWYGHDADRFAEFADRYRAELGAPDGQAALAELTGLAGRHRLVLLTATKDLGLSHARVLADFVRERLGQSRL